MCMSTPIKLCLPRLYVYANVPCRPPLKLGKLGETLGTRLCHLLFLSPRSLLGHVDFWMHMFQAGTSGMAGMALAVPVLRHWAFKVTTIDCRFFVRHPSVRAACKMGVGLMCKMMHHRQQMMAYLKEIRSSFLGNSYHLLLKSTYVRWSLLGALFRCFKWLYWLQ